MKTRIRIKIINLILIFIPAISFSQTIYLEKILNKQEVRKYKDYIEKEEFEDAEMLILEKYEKKHFVKKNKRFYIYYELYNLYSGNKIKHSLTCNTYLYLATYYSFKAKEKDSIILENQNFVNTDFQRIHSTLTYIYGNIFRKDLPFALEIYSLLRKSENEAAAILNKWPPFLHDTEFMIKEYEKEKKLNNSFYTEDFIPNLFLIDNFKRKIDTVIIEKIDTVLIPPDYEKPKSSYDVVKGAHEWYSQRLNKLEYEILRDIVNYNDENQNFNLILDRIQSEILDIKIDFRTQKSGKNGENLKVILNYFPMYDSFYFDTTLFHISNIIYETYKTFKEYKKEVNMLNEDMSIFFKINNSYRPIKEQLYYNGEYGSFINDCKFYTKNGVQLFAIKSKEPIFDDFLGFLQIYPLFKEFSEFERNFDYEINILQDYTDRIYLEIEFINLLNKSHEIIREKEKEHNKTKQSIEKTKKDLDYYEY